MITLTLILIILVIMLLQSSKISYMSHEVNNINIKLTDEINNLKIQQSLLVRALTNPSPLQSGPVGEHLLEQCLLGMGLRKNIDFVLQSEFRSSGKILRPDCVINLGTNKLILDSKAPLNTYFDFIQNPQSSEKKASFQRSMKDHIKSLKSKNYNNFIDGSLDFTILFIPFENIWIECLNFDKNLIKISQENKVLVATSYTLPFVLKIIFETISYINFAERTNKNAANIHNNLQHLDNNFKKLSNIQSNVRMIEQNLHNVNDLNKHYLSKLIELLKYDNTANNVQNEDDNII